jgi:4-diphosphocytidyl-2-C-methyl-D-erythritol kinase
MEYPRPTDKEIEFPNAKINIGLLVTERLPNGYHKLQSLFYPVDWCDALEVVPIGAVGTCRLTISGIRVDGDPESNLVVKAYRRLQQLFPQLPGVEVHLEKQIPFGAGFGGGSSDAARMLIMMRRLFHLPLTDEALEREAAALGADCTFFCRRGAQYLEGVGAELTPYPLSLQGKFLLLVKPSVSISTREAYSHVTPQRPAVPLYELLQQPLETWRETIHNDFEDSVFPLHPELAQVKETLYRLGARYASMSGSGSAFFGIFDQAPIDAQSAFPTDYQVRCVAATV